MHDATITMDTNKEVDVHINFRNDADDIVAPMSPVKHAHHWIGITDPIVNNVFIAGHIFPEKTDIWLSGAKTTAGTAHIDAETNLICVTD